eukprot:tig00021108_g18300.t1
MAASAAWSAGLDRALQQWAKAQESSSASLSRLQQLVASIHSLESNDGSDGLVAGYAGALESLRNRQLSAFMKALSNLQEDLASMEKAVSEMEKIGESAFQALKERERREGVCGSVCVRTETSFALVELVEALLAAHRMHADELQLKRTLVARIHHEKADDFANVASLWALQPSINPRLVTEIRLVLSPSEG